MNLRQLILINPIQEFLTNTKPILLATFVQTQNFTIYTIPDNMFKLGFLVFFAGHIYIEVINMKTETAKTSKAILVIEIVGLANDYCKKLKAKGHTEKYIKKDFR